MNYDDLIASLQKENEDLKAKYEKLQTEFETWKINIENINDDVNARLNDLQSIVEQLNKPKKNIFVNFGKETISKVTSVGSKIGSIKKDLFNKISKFGEFVKRKDHEIIGKIVQDREDRARFAERRKEIKETFAEAEKAAKEAEKAEEAKKAEEKAAESKAEREKRTEVRKEKFVNFGKETVSKITKVGSCIGMAPIFVFEKLKSGIDFVSTKVTDIGENIALNVANNKLERANENLKKAQEAQKNAADNLNQRKANFLNLGKDIPKVTSIGSKLGNLPKQIFGKVRSGFVNLRINALNHLNQSSSSKISKEEEKIKNEQEKIAKRNEVIASLQNKLAPDDNLDDDYYDDMTDLYENAVRR